ncbi:MAG: organic hydroperoxide resistance protein [Roseovarius sp.]|uniref:organic hydroperoxide resistance protein n=1 Tax=Roseovarius sp. TaxID=1486281 RepID=UPI0032F03CB5
MKILYETRATATGGRTGTTAVDDGSLNLSLSTPKALGGAGGDGTNPEQLFASGYAACFLSALHFVAGKHKQKLSDESRVSATVGIGPRDEGAGFALDVALSIHLPGLEKDLASKLVEEAHAACPYSHLAREGTDVRLTLD